MSLEDFLSDEEKAKLPPKETAPDEQEEPSILIDADNTTLITPYEKKMGIKPQILVGFMKSERGTKYQCVVPIDKTIEGFTLRTPKNRDRVTVVTKNKMKLLDGKTEKDMSYLESLFEVGDRHLGKFMEYVYGILYEWK